MLGPVYSCKAASDQIDVYSREPYFIVTSNASNSVTKQAKYQHVAVMSSLSLKILHIKIDEYSSYVASSTPFEPVNVVQYKPKTYRL